MDWAPLAISIKTASLSTLIAAVVGIPIAYLISRPFRGRALAAGLTIVPLVLPPTVLGYFLLVVLGKRSAFGALYHSVFHQQLVFTWQGAAVAASIASMPLMISQASVGFSLIDRAVIGAAMVDGARKSQLLRYITLPLAARSLAAGFALTFARSLGDFGATLMVAGDIPNLTQTMPLAVYDALQINDTRTVIVLVTVAAMLALLAAIAASLLAER